MNDATAEQASAPNRTELLLKVRQAWADVLDLDSADHVPDDVNFLEAGGSSLLLIMLWEELHPLASHTLKVSDLFQHSTVQAQVSLLAGSDGTGEEPAARLGAHNREGLLSRARRSQLVSE
ncbi:phosphopantetheine-binding protein [Streptomyces lushanensis]|uniref:phosphopantetheine-binding protein n=1 Tax=Streptomyces lushanensis TaxID=1434255 RepID=UPI00082991C8|nr:phosphopantetheine-binding protein [Streptomyces lushanensis]